MMVLENKLNLIIKEMMRLKDNYQVYEMLFWVLTLLNLLLCLPHLGAYLLKHFDGLKNIQIGGLVLFKFFRNMNLILKH